jgi:hypothetical protein
MCWVLAACSTGADEDRDISSFFFPTQPAPAGDVMEALLTGTLLPDDRDCLRVATEGGEPYLVIWPYGFTLKADGPALHVLDETGQLAAVVGSVVSLGGGEIPQEAYEAGHPDLPDDQCPGPYWIVGEITPPQ